MQDQVKSNSSEKSKWGPPADNNGPKSLMDVNLNKSASPGGPAGPRNMQNQFRGPRPNGPPNQGAPPPWMNQQRGPPPPNQMGNGPPPNTGVPPPWQQGPPPRGISFCL